MLTKNVFYGKQRGKSALIQAKLARREKEIRTNKIPAPYKSSITGPSSAWKIFFKQSEAFKFAKLYGKDMWVFSYESYMFFERKGQRLYLATSLDKFWHYYRQLDEALRHHYEIIPEGSVCHLYFDLEYDRSFNEEHNGPAMTAVFAKCVCQELRRRYNITCSMENVLQLDASTDAKYSCHLVFKLNNAAFHDNISAGNFVRELCDKIKNTVIQNERNLSEGSDSENLKPICDKVDHRLQELAVKNTGSNGNLSSPECKKRKMDPSDCHDLLDETFLREALVKSRDLESLFVVDKHGRKSIFCDQGVYTKNRNFRLYLSCKRGKSNPLILAPENRYVPQKVRHGRDLTQEEIEKAYFLDSLVSLVSFSPTLKILRCEDGNSQDGSNHPRSSSSSCQADCLEGQRCSPYVEVDLYLKEVLTERGHGGYLRRWAYFHQMEMIIYDIGGDRWCENVQRQHKSNNIMFVVDLRGGVFYQKCHDPDCRRAGFRSQEQQLPKHVLPASILQDDPWEEDEETEELTDEQMLQIEAEMLHMEKIRSRNSVGLKRDLSMHEKTLDDSFQSNTESLRGDFDDDLTDEQLMNIVDQMDS